MVTDADQSPAARLADATVGLALLEDSNVRTIGYTGTLQALFLLADALAGGRARTTATGTGWRTRWTGSCPRPSDSRTRYCRG